MDEVRENDGEPNLPDEQPMETEKGAIEGGDDDDQLNPGRLQIDELATGGQGSGMRL